MSTQSRFQTGPRPKPGKRYYTVSQANAALPYVRRVAEDVRASYKRALELQQRLERPTPGDEPDQIRAAYDAEVERLRRCAEELEAAGIELKDHQRGLLDFPAVHQGREVLLCWQLGEDAIGHWHETDAGFAGRQDVALLE